MGSDKWDTLIKEHNFNDEMKKAGRKRLCGIIICYAVFIITYFIGAQYAGSNGLEYRSWIDMLFRLVLWAVPVFILGLLLFSTFKKGHKNRGSLRFLWMGIFVVYVAVAAFLTFLYIFISAVNLSTDEKMEDGNLVVTVSDGMESFHYYAEPVGFLFRRTFEFDDDRLAYSLSKMYDLHFSAKKSASGDTIFVSPEFPELNVRVIRTGYIRSSYIEDDLRYILTSKMLDKHKDIFNSYHVELIDYPFSTASGKDVYKNTFIGVLVSEENKEFAADAVAKFIHKSLSEDYRADGKGVWKNIDGSIFVLIEDEQTGEIQSYRNIPFSLNPKYSWIYGKDVTKNDILKSLESALEAYEKYGKVSKKRSA